MVCEHITYHRFFVPKSRGNEHDMEFAPMFEDDHRILILKYKFAEILLYITKRRNPFFRFHRNLNAKYFLMGFAVKKRLLFFHIYSMLEFSGRHPISVPSDVQFFLLLKYQNTLLSLAQSVISRAFF